MTTAVKLSSGADVVAAFPSRNAEAVRFDIAIDCGNDSCDLVIRREGAPDVVFPISDAKFGMALRQPDLMLYFDSVSRAGFPDPTTGRMQTAQLSLMRWIASLYEAVLPLALPAALSLFILELAWCLHRRTLPAATVLAASLLAALACRLAILGYAFATFAPLIEPRYLSPAHPLGIAFVVIVATTTAQYVRTANRAFHARSTTRNGNHVGLSPDARPRRDDGTGPPLL
jgi:hypothetical protein